MLGLQLPRFYFRLCVNYNKKINAAIVFDSQSMLETEDN